MGSVIPIRAYANTTIEDDFSLEEVVKQSSSQQKIIIELLQKLSENKSNANTATWTVNPSSSMMSYNFLTPTLPSEVIKPATSAATSQQVRSIPLHTLLEIGSLIVGAISIASIAVWISGHIPLINPFASLLILIASPFFYAMGKIARNIK